MPLIELRPNGDLVDASFYGYKLSLESVPIFKLILNSGVDHISPSDEQYSFLHVKAFGLHNHLYADPWAQESVYFIDKYRSVQRVSLSNTNRPESFGHVWEIPNEHKRRTGLYNMSLSFPSPELVVLSDGAGTLFVVATGQRNTNCPWKLIFSGDVCEKEQPFTILQSRHIIAAGRQEIHSILLHIDESVIRERDDKESGPVFMNVLEWIVIAEEHGHTWEVKSRRQLCAPGNLEYAAVEESGQCIYVVGSKDIKFIADSEKPIELTPEHETKVAEKGKPEYLWLQTTQDITVWFQLPLETTKCEVSVSTQPKHLKVACRDHVLLNGVTWHTLDSGVTTWKLERGKLEVTLSKTEQGLMWQELVKEDKRGEEVVDFTLAADIHERLAHLCADKQVKDPTGGCPTGLNTEQLEECDAFPVDSTVLARLDSNIHKASHQINLGGHQWLFSVELRPGSVPAICVRHDVDGCVWQPRTPENDDPNWPCTHIGTFLAFGYVLASKEQKKFTVCAPDLSYVAVCEATRHVYIYHQPSSVVGELRNRLTGQQVAQVAKQQLVNLDTNSEVLGIQATNTVLFILCSETLLVLHVNVT